MMAFKEFGWKASKVEVPPSQQLANQIRRTKIYLALTIAAAILFYWMSMDFTAEQRQRFYCRGPSKSPRMMTPNENAEWYAHLSTPVIFNQHKPVDVSGSEVRHIDLNTIKSTTEAIKNKERVLILTPLRDASMHLAKYFDILTQLTYPHELIDLGFLIGDTTDDTLAILAKELERVGNDPKIAFRSSTIVEKDFGVTLSQGVHDRHSFEAQGPRRKALGRARNYLLASSLKPDHSWVYWRDVDIEESPATIIEDFIAHDRDVLVPNIWFHRLEEKDSEMVDIEGRFDYNSWQESPDGLALAASLPKNVILAEGYKRYPTNRTYMALLGDRDANKDVEMPLDGIGGVSIVVKADVHRSGINFPCYAFEHQAETEGFAKMARKAGYGVFGLPNNVVWHVDTEELPGNA